MVEFQRTSGCTVLFNNFYYRILEKLGEHFLRRGHMPKGTQEKLLDVLPVTVPDFLFPSRIYDENDEYCRGLFTFFCNDAMWSEYLDRQQYAMWTLAQISHNQSAFLKRNMEKILPVLRSGLTSVDGMVQEDTCKILVNLCSQEHLSVLMHLREYLFIVLDARDTLENRSSKRYAKKILSNLLY